MTEWHDAPVSSTASDRILGAIGGTALIELRQGEIWLLGDMYAVRDGRPTGG